MPDSSGCPKCPGAGLLRKMDGAGVSYDSCPACKGLWLDAADLSRVLQEKGGLKTDDATRLIEPKPTTAACPRCGKPMDRGGFVSPLLLVENCAACGGVWLDSGEMRVLRKLLGIPDLPPTGGVEQRPSGTTPLMATPTTGKETPSASIGAPGAMREEIDPRIDSRPSGTTPPSGKDEIRPTGTAAPMPQPLMATPPTGKVENPPAGTTPLMATPVAAEDVGAAALLSGAVVSGMLPSAVPPQPATAPPSGSPSQGLGPSAPDAARVPKEDFLSVLKALPGWMLSGCIFCVSGFGVIFYGVFRWKVFGGWHGLGGVEDAPIDVLGIGGILVAVGLAGLLFQVNVIELIGQSRMRRRRQPLWWNDTDHY